MNLRLDAYKIVGADLIMTPALVIYPQLVDANIEATLKMLGGDPNRWRPHIKTAKIASVLRRLLDYGVINFKCSTTLELLTACEVGATDVLLAYPVVGVNASRTLEIANQFPGTRVSVLVETHEQALPWRNSNLGMFIDINPGMDRTGISEERVADIVELARGIGRQFRGLHYYDGHISPFDLAEGQRNAHEGYNHLMQIHQALIAVGFEVGELITSGTPASPFALTYSGFDDESILHRVSPGTVVYNDTTSLKQLPEEYGYRAAAIVLSTVVSHPKPRVITCDAGHKSVSADAGVPTCSVIGQPHLTPLKPSEEHLPIESASDNVPQIGDRLYLVPRHVCPTVNNFDEVLFVVDGRVQSIERVTARGHESPLATKHAQLLTAAP